MLREQVANATKDTGVWKLPAGDKLYATMLGSFTTTTLPAEDVHAIGLREVARIEAEIVVLLREFGHRDGPVKERHLKLKQASSAGIEK